MQQYVRRKVITGKKRGRIFGFPTTNLNLYKKDNLKSGVYVVRVKVDGKNLSGVAHVGKSETFFEKEPKIEIYIFDYNKDLYNRIIKVNFLKKLRETKYFDNKNELITQIKKDCEMAKRYLNN
jgi:riboflavin kinase/FMN adenylyltransferase